MNTVGHQLVTTIAAVNFDRRPHRGRCYCDVVAVLAISDVRESNQVKQAKVKRL